MDKQKRNAGITLIALVISIIVMLILAGVSLNATVGDNGILKQAMEASNKQKLAQEIENLNLELAKLNIDTITNNEADSIQNIVDYLIKQGVIDEAVKTSSGAIAVGVDRETGSKYFFGEKGEHIYKISRGKDDILVAELSQSVSGGQIEGGSSLVTADSFDNDSSLPPEEKGKFNITSDANVAFMDTISGELCFYIKSGVHAVVEIYADMTLTNEGIKRSAIDIEPGGTLDLYVGEGVTLTVDSGFGEDAQGSIAGKGGYAGIHVPWIDSNNDGERNDGEQAELNLYGKGTITAIGGNAGSGEIATDATYKAGGGGAGAGIGGNGGNGGKPEKGLAVNYKICSSGGIGESCGLINIYNFLSVYAYGGSGGSGGTSARDIGGGAGGYPGAGIGGGGAGGAGATCCAGAGGYSGGSAEGNPNRGINGSAGYMALLGENMNWQGGGYYIGQEGLTANNNEINLKEDVLGGFGGCAWYPGHSGGDGGTAGKGGTLKVSKNAKVYAFNGNKYTDNTDYKKGENQAVIYLQNGISLPRYEHIGNETYTTNDPTHSNGYKLRKIKELSTEEKKSGYINIYYDNIEKYADINKYLTNVDMSRQGVGSGAGYIELDNGTYTLCNEVNGELVPIES